MYGLNDHATEALTSRYLFILNRRAWILRPSKLAHSGSGATNHRHQRGDEKARDRQKEVYPFYERGTIQRLTTSSSICPSERYHQNQRIFFPKETHLLSGSTSLRLRFDFRSGTAFAVVIAEYHGPLFSPYVFCFTLYLCP
ncbi:hypothetical protein EVAR_42545_1 [Eumeta japonica]|uniref:Uncharacterized protein n=1 Tax=Eumeta variegata TaxID=151549 RepID=A0A4C1WUL2_EUMVA|nr:hypothetical protein EVAR_42545_1 [Eumeta japonica]